MSNDIALGFAFGFAFAFGLAPSSSPVDRGLRVAFAFDFAFAFGLPLDRSPGCVSLGGSSGLNVRRAGERFVNRPW